MSKLTCIIIEDEPLAVKILTDYVMQVPFLDLKATFRDAIVASEYLRNHHVDLMFLDIHLPRLKGMAFLKTLKEPPEVIITTAYHQYAIEGFELNVTDYLLKPIEFERFLMAVNKVRKAGHEDVVKNDSSKSHFFLNVQKKKVKVLFDDILYVESQREYTKIVTTKGEYLPKMSTHEIAAMLPEKEFRQVHRSFIISVDKIDSYTADTIEIKGVSIPVGRGYKEVLDDLFG